MVKGMFVFGESYVKTSGYPRTRDSYSFYSLWRMFHTDWALVNTHGQNTLVCRIFHVITVLVVLV